MEVFLCMCKIDFAFIFTLYTIVVSVNMEPESYEEKKEAEWN